VLVCTKWDALKDTGEPEGLRVLAHALRWLAHSNTAHLVYLEGLQHAGATGGVGRWPCTADACQPGTGFVCTDKV
jgi:hypothetical protein